MLSGNFFGLNNKRLTCI